MVSIIDPGTEAKRRAELEKLRLKEEEERKELEESPTSFGSKSRASRATAGRPSLLMKRMSRKSRVSMAMSGPQRSDSESRKSRASVKGKNQEGRAPSIKDLTSATDVKSTHSPTQATNTHT